MSNPRVLFGITGSIAAYKMPELIRLFTKSGTICDTLLSRQATRFVTPLTIETISGVKASVDCVTDDHISRIREADIFVIAPATANVIAKLAHGFADSQLTTAFLAFTGPKLIVPAMHTEMYDNPTTQHNITTLKDTGVSFLGPINGDLSCGDVGMGRMIDINLIYHKINAMLLPPLDLQGQTILVSAGGTCEPIDPVRVITNLSTGQLGHQIAMLASFYGATVKLVTTKPIPKTPGIDVTPVQTMAEMNEALHNLLPECNAVFMAAAVSDFTIEKSAHKKKRESFQNLKLTPTSDILKSLSQKNINKAKLIGFCLDSSPSLSDIAKKKLRDKNLHYIVANSPDSIGAKNRTFTIYGHTTPPIQVQNKPILSATHQLIKAVL